MSPLQFDLMGEFNSHPSLVVASLDKMLHDNYLRLVESNKQQIEEVRSKIQGQLLSVTGFVLCIAPPSLSRDRRIKMKKSMSLMKALLRLKYCEKIL